MLQVIEDTTRNTQQQWLKFMLERVGHNNLSQLLEYYQGIGWISIDVADRLLLLAENEKVRYEGPGWTMSPEEHRTSLQFIERIMGRCVDISVLSIPSIPARAIISQKTKDKPREGYIESYQLEKENMEFAIQRREVTIDNLEQELEKRDIEMVKLKDKLLQLEKLYEECQIELKKNMVYREILEENVRLKKAELFRKSQ